MVFAADDTPVIVFGIVTVIGLVVFFIVLARQMGAIFPAAPPDVKHLLRLEQKLDLLMSHFGIEVPDPATAAGLSAEVRQLADDRRKKIEAIKLHREQTGLTLKEAKDAVEAYMNR